MPFPERILAGSGWNSQGYGLELAEKAGAEFHRLDHQWNYVTGLPDPRYEEGIRGVNALAYDAIYVNMSGERFVNECLSAKYTLPALLEQPTGSYWAVFDEEGKKDFMITGSGWSRERIDQLVFRDEAITKIADTIEGLAKATGLPEDALGRTVTRFNQMVKQQKDKDFDRLAPDNDPRCRDLKALERLTGGLSIQRFDLEDGQVQIRAKVSPGGPKETTQLITEIKKAFPHLQVSYVNLDSLV